jgi:heterotetrameric sarcosine oxidase gamma subunit
VSSPNITPISTLTGAGFVFDHVIRSPIAQLAPTDVVSGWEVSTRKVETDQWMADITPLAKVLVRSDDPAVATWATVTYGRSAALGRALVVGSAPGEWLLLGPAGSAVALLEEVPAGGFTVALDQTHGRALVRIAGPSTAMLLSKVCAMDLSEDMCPNGAAFRAPVAGVSTDVIRHDLAGTRSYLLHCERSSGQYLFNALLDAGAEYSTQIQGFGPASIL